MMSPGTPQIPPGERLRRVGVSAWSLIGIAIVVAMTAWLLFKIRVIFPPLVLALLIIYVLNPVVTILVRRGLPRVIAAVTAFLGAIGVVVVLVIAVSPFITNQVTEFAKEWPKFKAQVVDITADGAARLEDSLGISIDTTPVTCLFGSEEQTERARCAQITERLREQITGQTERITAIGLTVLEGLLVFVLAPLIALYMLIDLPQLQRDLLNLVPESHRAEAADLGEKVARAGGGFFRGQLLVALTVGVLSAVGFAIIGLPFWLVIGAIAGFFNLIPLVGPFIGGAIGFFVGTVTGGIGLGIRAALVELIVQQLDNHLISPLVMRRAVKLHPATVALALLAGGGLAGFWGVLLGVPTVAVGKILLGHLWATRVLGAQATPYVPRRAKDSPPSPPEAASAAGSSPKP
jgi:predicted PurR-regulated permease PerM